MYDSNNQYRCPIIRGKSQRDMDNFLPAYAQIIIDVCPCLKKNFESEFNNRLAKYLPEGTTEKTLDNHRTEVAGKLFGMYYSAESNTDGQEYVYAGERTLKYLQDQDQPAFFKDICSKMQFPNGMAKPEATIERIELGISVRPCCYVIEVLSEASRRNMKLSKNDIGYYVLNSLDALTRKASPFEVVDAIQIDRMNGVFSHEIGDPTKEDSYNFQHIKEQLNYMELANLLIISTDGIVKLNPKEDRAISLFASHWDDEPLFDVTAYDLSSPQTKNYFQDAWNEYYARLSPDSAGFDTPAAALVPEINEGDNENEQNRSDTTELGDEGEKYVFEYEKQRVLQFDAKLVDRVLAVGKIKGLGYDIQTLVAEPGKDAEQLKYIEVKSTKRVTAPDIKDTKWMDTVDVTRNEWIAAQRYGMNYAIYRVYFVRGSVVMYVIENPYNWYEDEKIQVVPTMYKIDFNSGVIDRVIAI